MSQKIFAFALASLVAVSAAALAHSEQKRSSYDCAVQVKFVDADSSKTVYVVVDAYSREEANDRAISKALEDAGRTDYFSYAEKVDCKRFYEAPRI